MGDKINILVVDDLPEKVLVLRSILEELDENVLAARSGPEALKQILDNEFAVILLDVNMPGMDGFETATLIRKRRRSAHTPIIFVTAFADEMHTSQGYSLGAVDYILAPVVPEVLRTKVRVFVELFRMTQQVRRQADERVALASEQAARAAAEEAIHRTNFLAEASRILAKSLDFDATLCDLARLPVPFLADFAAVTYTGGQDRPWRTEMAWVHPPDETVRTCSLPEADAPNDALRAAVERVLVSGTVEHFEDERITYPPSTCASGGQPLRSVVILPLLARGMTLGALSLGLSAAGHRRVVDLPLAEDFAGRSAIDLDNSRLYQSIQEADHRKNEFLSMLAHELRNPLAPIRNAVHLLQVQGPADAQLRKLLGMIDRQVQHLVRLVDDLLDLSRITRGKIRLQTEPIEAGAVVARAVETSRPLIEARKHQLQVSLPPEPLRVQADPVRLAQVLANLLNNAAKYTEEGGRIWMTVERRDSEAVFQVRDTGVGIPPEMLATVFDPFTQVERSLDRSQGGLGIGLTLVRRLVELHGGTVEASSAGPNQGSEFVVRLPALAAEQLTAPALNGGSHTNGAADACRVLLVDDNRDGAESLAMLLRLSGHEVRVCNDGPAALVAASEFRPDVVLLDIGLPGMDGFEVARRLRQRSELENVMLVALTGYGQEEDRRKAQQCGFDHHLVKPADPAALTALFAARAPV
jgi:signal transduction histidine kinase/DNA-binding response OmpR family regulator